MKRYLIVVLVLAVVFAAPIVVGAETGPDTVIGEALSDLDGLRDNVRTGETNLGNLIADIMKHYGDEADIGLMNSGSIRKSISKGPITIQDVLEVYTFNNWIVTVEMTGGELKEVLEHSVSFYPDAAGGFLQVSGISFTFDPEQPVGSRVVEIIFEDNPVEDDDVFYVATTNMVARGGDGYEMLGNLPMSRLQDLYTWDFTMVRDAVLEYFQEMGTVDPTIEGRIKIK